MFLHNKVALSLFAMILTLTIACTSTPTLNPLPTYTPYPTATPQPTPEPLPTATSYPTYTPLPTHTPLATYTPYPTHTSVPPTTTPRPTPTKVSTPRPTFTLTPRPTPRPNTGQWFTWGEIKDLAEATGAKEELPRILVNDDGYQSRANLQIDCQQKGRERTLELYVSWRYYLDGDVIIFMKPTGTPQVEYTIKGGQSLVRHWSPGKSDGKVHSVFAPPAVRDDILSALSQGAGRLSVTVEESTFGFPTHGFIEAIKPVFDACGR